MKNNFLLVASLLFSNIIQAQVNVFECTPANSGITQQIFSNYNIPYIQQPCVFFENQTPYSFNNNAPKSIRAINSIDIKTDFHAIADGNNSRLHLHIANKADFEVVCTNNTDLTQVPKLKKFELGITLPNAIQEKVDLFLDGESDSNLYLNPYLNWDLRVFVEFTHPNVNGVVTVDGFYSQKYDAWMQNPLPNPDTLNTPNAPHEDVLYTSLGGYNQISTDYPFLIRFSPPELGKWTAKVTIVAPNQYYESEFFYFSVIESGSPGYVTTDNENRYFKLGGGNFYPLGANVLWPLTHNNIKNNEGLNDPYLEDILRMDDGTVLSEDFREVKPIPRIFDNHRNHIRNIYEGGGNFVRILMHPFAQDIEYEHLGDYTNRLHIAQEMDKTLEYCEDRNIYIDWNLQVHYPYANGGYKHSWDKTIFGEQNCYKSINGINEAKDFFTSETAKKFYKQRYRYILARWGYSTNIAMFELFSEINGGNAGYYTGTAQVAQAWQEEMVSYIKSFYNGKTHLLQASYTGSIPQSDKTIRHESIDVVTTNQYAGLKTFAKKWIDILQKDYLNQRDEYLNEINTLAFTGSCKLGDSPSTSYCDYFFKPFFMPEFNPGGELTGYDGLIETCDDLQIEVKRSMWQVPFSGAAGALSWDSFRNGIVYPEFAKIKLFLSNMEGKGGFHPGAMERLSGGRWAYRSDWAADMDHDRNVDHQFDSNSKVDLMYLRSGDRNYAFGVITNKSFNLETEDGCFPNDLYNDQNEMPNFDDLTPAWQEGLVNTENENLKLQGLNSGKYYITYFYPNTQGTPFDSDEGYGETIPLKVLVPATYDNYIVLFMARHEGYDWMPALNDSVTEIRSDKFRVSDSMKKEALASIENLLEFKVYPIPSRDKVIIENFSNLANVQIKVLSMDGKTIDTKILEGNKTELDISQLEKGVYMIKFFKEDIEIKQNKIIKL